MNLFRNKVLLKWREPQTGWKFVKRHLTWSQWPGHYLRIVVKTVVLMILLFAAIRLFRGRVESIADLLSMEAVVVGAVFGIFFSF